MVSGEDGGGVQGLEGALRDLEVVVLEEIQAAVDQCRDFRRTQALPRSFQDLMKPLDPGHSLLRVFGTRQLQRFLHCGSDLVRSALDLNAIRQNLGHIERERETVVEMLVEQ